MAVAVSLAGLCAPPCHGCICRSTTRRGVLAWFQGPLASRRLLPAATAAGCGSCPRFSSAMLRAPHSCMVMRSCWARMLMQCRTRPRRQRPVRTGTRARPAPGRPAPRRKPEPISTFSRFPRSPVGACSLVTRGPGSDGLLRASPELPAWHGGSGAGWAPVPCQLEPRRLVSHLISKLAVRKLFEKSR